MRRSISSPGGRLRPPAWWRRTVRGKLPFVGQSRGRVEQRDQQLALLSPRAPGTRSASLRLATPALAPPLAKEFTGRRRPTTSCKASSLSVTKRRMRSGVKCGCSTIDRAAERTSLRAALARAAGLGVTKQDQRLLGQVQVAGVDENLSRRGEPAPMRSR